MTSGELRIYTKCINFSAIKHKNQRRRDSERTPFINHPIGVAAILSLEANITDINILMTAILHDTVEDTDTTIEEIEKEFGSVISGLVAEVTDDKSLPKAERKRLQIVHAPTTSYEAKLVKLADKIYNLRDLQRVCPIGWTTTRVREYFEWSSKVVDGLRGTNAILEQILDDIFKKEGITYNKPIGTTEEVTATSDVVPIIKNLGGIQ